MTNERQYKFVTKTTRQTLFAGDILEAGGVKYRFDSHDGHELRVQKIVNGKMGNREYMAPSAFGLVRVLV